MKKVIFVTAMMLTVGMTAFAGKKDEISSLVTSSFSKDFASAKQVKWQKERNFVKATFTLDNEVMYAYYNESGELMGLVRNILSDKLPIGLMTGLKKNYSGYWITDLFEMAANGQSTYYVTIENAEETVMLVSEGSGSWSVNKKAKKNNE